MCRKCSNAASQEGQRFLRRRLTRPGEIEPTSGVSFIAPSALAFQPPSSGESSSSTPRASFGYRAAHIRLRNPPSEWPTSTGRRSTSGSPNPSCSLMEMYTLACR